MTKQTVGEVWRGLTMKVISFESINIKVFGYLLSLTMIQVSILCVQFNLIEVV